MNGLCEHKVALIDALSIHTFVADAITGTINTFGLVFHNLGNGISFTEVDGYGADALCFGKALRHTINAVNLASSTKESRISTE
jgi:hypothetical protein